MTGGLLKYLLLPLFVVLTLSSCRSGGERRGKGEESGVGANAAGNLENAARKSADFTDQAWHWADSVAASMDSRRLAAQMVMPALYADTLRSPAELLALYADTLQLGGVLFLKGTASEARHIASRLQRRIEKVSGIPMFVAIDAEWGLGMRFPSVPEFPANGEIDPSADDQLMYDYGYEMGREARLAGINVVFGPVMDVERDGSVMGVRSFGQDAARCAALGTAYARGLEDGCVISVAKHFPGLGATLSDSHRKRPVLRVSAENLHDIDLLPYREYIDAGLSGVMVGHVAVPAIDSVNRSAAVSPLVIGGLLRSQMGFKGLVFTDALNMGGLGDTADAEVEALKAGADVVVAPVGTARAVERIAASIETGSFPLREARERCRRILFYKYRFLKGVNLSRVVESESLYRELNTPSAASISSRLGGGKGKTHR